LPREAHIERQVQWKNKLSKYGCRVNLEKTVYIRNAPVIVDVYAENEGKTYLIEIGDISDKRKIALMELYAKQNQNIEFIHEPYNTNKIGEVLDNLIAYRNSDEFLHLQLAKMEDRKNKRKMLVALLFVFVVPFLWFLSYDTLLAFGWVVIWFGIPIFLVFFGETSILEYYLELISSLKKQEDN